MPARKRNTVKLPVEGGKKRARTCTNVVVDSRRAFLASESRATLPLCAQGGWPARNLHCRVKLAW